MSASATSPRRAAAGSSWKDTHAASVPASSAAAWPSALELVQPLHSVKIEGFRAMPETKFLGFGAAGVHQHGAASWSSALELVQRLHSVRVQDFRAMPISRVWGCWRAPTRRRGMALRAGAGAAIAQCQG